MVESTKAYREAAGVFNYVSNKIDHRDWSYIEKFPELTSPVCSSLTLICLAEGQVSVLSFFIFFEQRLCFVILLPLDCD